MGRAAVPPGQPGPNRHTRPRPGGGEHLTARHWLIGRGISAQGKFLWVTCGVCGHSVDVGAELGAGPAGDEAMRAVARAYLAFARREARGRSASYEALAECVAADTALVGFIA